MGFVAESQLQTISPTFTRIVKLKRARYRRYSAYDTSAPGRDSLDSQYITSRERASGATARSVILAYNRRSAKASVRATRSCSKMAYSEMLHDNSKFAILCGTSLKQGAQ